MFKDSMRIDPGFDFDLVFCYCSAFRQAIRIRRELSILSRTDGVGGDRARLLNDLALARTAMDSAHEGIKRVLETRIPTFVNGG